MIKRIGIIDIWRIVACMIIMSYHLPTLDNKFTEQNYPFAVGWIFVEFFFIITGCFTFKHFSTIKYSDADTIGILAIGYTIKKFISFMPYVVVAFTLRCILMLCWGSVESDFLLKILPEILLLSRGEGVLPVVWFLSSLFIVFPVFCCICQIKQKHIVYIFSLLAVIVIYDTYLIKLGVRTPTHLIRALAGLLLGILVAYTASLISQVNYKRWERLFLTIAEEGALVLACHLSYINSTLTNVIIILFFFSLSIMVSGVSYTGNIGSSFTDLLGKISLGMYLNQDIVAIIIKKYVPQDYIGIKIILYYLLNFIVSGIICIVIKKRVDI